MAKPTDGGRRETLRLWRGVMIGGAMSILIWTLFVAVVLALI